MIPLPILLGLMLLGVALLASGVWLEARQTRANPYPRVSAPSTVEE